MGILTGHLDFLAKVWFLCADGKHMFYYTVLSGGLSMWEFGGAGFADSQGVPVGSGLARIFGANKRVGGFWGGRAPKSDCDLASQPTRIRAGCNMPNCAQSAGERGQP